ncbi:unnamed protein product [Polarella glacialis]|uniref:Transmembrane protein n=1 Tax=Polarella glacialis TaxID=89957 RepID=A0A813JHF8_POLGL|nr:unnamed protein product [Polarella glacialis]CAE8677475.1 unnamed protein product [Polarella glacialis]
MSRLMRLISQCCPFGLALLVFIVVHLFEKLASMEMLAAPLVTAVVPEVATAATESQWNTLLFWVMCLIFVGLVVLGKHLLDFIRQVKYNEPLLPVWVVQQQQQPLLAQRPRDGATRKLSVSEPPRLQQNAFDPAAKIAQLDFTSRCHSDQTGWSPGGCFPPQPFSSATDAATGGTAGFSQAELVRLASNERWIALPASYKRAAGEIYRLIRSAGHSTVSGWFTSVWWDVPESQQRRNLFHSATLCDMRIEEFLRAHGTPGLEWALTRDDMLESLFRQLSSAREFQLTGDAAAASRILAFSSSSGSVLPSWLQNEARRWSNQVHKQGLRVCGPKCATGHGTTDPKNNTRTRPFGTKSSGAAGSTEC